MRPNRWRKRGGRSARNPSPCEPGGSCAMLLLIANYDSFTYNLYQYLSELGAEIAVRRHDQVPLDEIPAMRPEHMVISPGPCAPNEADLSCEIIAAFGPHTTI